MSEHTDTGGVKIVLEYNPGNRQWSSSIDMCDGSEHLPMGVFVCMDDALLIALEKVAELEERVWDIDIAGGGKFLRVRPFDFEAVPTVAESDEEVPT